MKHIYGIVALFFSGFLFAQDLSLTTQTVNASSETNNIEVSYFRGNIYQHTAYVTHLITGHPDGVLISLNRQTFGAKEWEQAYNFPDYGMSFQYQDFGNETLGKAMALAVHYNFYFLNRHLQFRISQGIGYATNPYDKETNYKNNAFGSTLLSSNLFMLNYKKQHLVGRFGIQAGLMFTHFSNGRVKSPNSGINTYAANIGVNYNLDAEQPQYVSNDTLSRKSWREPLRYSLYFRSGVSESLIVGSGQKPFYHIGLAVDKRVGRKSAIQLGTDIFFSLYLKEYIRYMSIAYPDRPYLDPNTDYKRVAVFVGHELFVNRLSIETQVGFYVYKPYKYESDVYQRLGAKYYVTKNLFAGIALKAHGGRAEAIEVGIGARI
ncbi:acyloxyacyl hydrolase [Flavobacterium silvaticum]|uniref:Acyloxyacyl hydrolase n=1 Tax=Flavobacterium silvaticum TaxID=1852020 RepID=A0A972JET4_9FLAO|nr:acyloxyacyl hydrolase [Flavobacterium silvaticum]NMH27239.1 acyloxyacyl hydrolase [Flavobacterium silvaticum]